MTQPEIVHSLNTRLSVAPCLRRQRPRRQTFNFVGTTVLLCVSVLLPLATQSQPQPSPPPSSQIFPPAALPIPSPSPPQFPPPTAADLAAFPPPSFPPPAFQGTPAAGSGPLSISLRDGMVQLIPLPKIPESQIRELITDLIQQLEITSNYRKANAAELAAMASPPMQITAGDAAIRTADGRQDTLRFGYLIAPRRLPQLWVYGESGNDKTPNPDLNTLGATLQTLMTERTKLMSKLGLGDLESRVLNLSYMDAAGALFALRAMGYSTITDDDALAKEDSYRGQDVPMMSGTAASGNGAGMPMDAAFQGQPAAFGTQSGQGGDGKLGPRFPAAKFLPSSISLDRLPLVVRMPSPESRNTGLVGAEYGGLPGSATPAAQRDQLGLTVIPSAATNLQENVAAGTSQLLVLFHPNYPEQFFKLRKLIQDTIDKPARQVFVEGLILEVSSEALRELGVKWDIKKGSEQYCIGTLPCIGTLMPVPAGAAALNFLRDSLVNISPTQIKAQINALVQTNKAEILSRPSVMTLDNRQATIRVGTDIPVATSKDTGGAGSGRVAFSFQYIPTGILLNVRPRISEDGNEISMLIDATVSATVPNQDLRVIDPTTRIALASAPTISTRRVQTYARIRNNQPLIIGGLVSRDQISSADKVPGIGEIPLLGKLFGSESKRDSKREVIIVLTPSVVTENVRETKAQAPKDDDIFDLRDTALFKEHYRIRAEDLVDSSYLRLNRRFLAYRDVNTRILERNPELTARAPYSQFTAGRVPGEFVFVTGMMSRMLARMNAGEPIKIENLMFFETTGTNTSSNTNELRDQRPISVAQVMARYGDGQNYRSFFAKNPGKALALSFRLGRTSTAAQDMFTEATPEVQLIDCPDRNRWRQLLWEMNQPVGNVPRFTILIQDESDLKRLQTAVATQNTILNNGGVNAMVFDNWLPGRMLHLQEVTPTWERILQGPIAQYFFIGEYYNMYFMREHEAAIQELDKALRQPALAPSIEGITLP